MNCKTCGGPLRITRPGDEGICPHCTMAGLFDDPETSPGSGEVEDYDIKKEIGRGGDGTVYLGFDSKVGREVAIKLINSDRRIDETTERRFQTESEAIASLDHPHIIPIYANGKMDGRPFYTMKYVTGGSLATRLDEFATPDAAAALMIKVARAVHHAHERGILHRDLKPSNILLDDQLEPFISDFGLAKRYEENNDLTLTGAVMGTPAFMSPEQARGDNAQITTTSDVFSLGSIFYQILTGKLPFEGTTSHHVLRSVIETQITFSRDNRQTIGKDLITICLKCLEKDPAKRYPSALALAEDLERWRNGEPIEARHLKTGERFRKWIRRHPVATALVAVSILSLLTIGIGGSIFTLRLQEANREIVKKSAEEHEALVRLTEDKGLRYFEEGDYFSALPWFVSALKLDSGNEERELVHRRRIGVALRSSPKLVHLWRHKVEASKALFSPNGKQILIVAKGGIKHLRLLQTASGLNALGPMKHRTPIKRAVFNHDGSRIACACEESEVWIWDTATGSPVFPALVDSSSAVFIGFSRDGSQLITASSEGILKVRNAVTGEEILSKPQGFQIESAALDPNGGRIAIGSIKGDLRIVDLAHGAILFESKTRFKSSAQILRFSDDGSRFMAISGIRAQVFDSNDGRLISPELTHGREKIYDGAFDPSGTRLATSGGDGMAHIRDIESGSSNFSPLRHKHRVHRLAFSPLGDRILTCSDDKTAVFWSTKTGERIGPPLRHRGPIVHIDFSHDGSMVLTTDSGETRLWSLAQEMLAGPIITPSKAYRMGVSHDEEHVVVADDSNGIERYHVASGLAVGDVSRIDPFTLPAAPCDSHTIRTRNNPSGDSKAIIDDNMAVLYESETGDRLGKSMEHGNLIRVAKFSDDGRLLATGSSDKTARVWDATSGKPITPPLASEEEVVNVDFSDSSDRLATSSNETWISVWDLSPALNSIEELAKLSKLLSGFEIHPRFGLIENEDPPDETILDGNRLPDLAKRDQWIWNSILHHHLVNQRSRTGAELAKGVPDGDDLDPLRRRVLAKLGTQTLTPEDLEKLNGHKSLDGDIGDKLKLARKWEPAELHLKKAVAEDPNRSAFWRNLADTQAGLDQADASLESRNRAILANPNSANLYQNRGLTYLKMEKWNESVADFRSAARIHSKILFTSVGEDSPIPLREGAVPASCIDLSDYYNNSLDHYHLIEEIPDKDLTDIPRGLVEFGGIPFDVRGGIRLMGSSSTPHMLPLPSSVPGIEIARRCQRLHFLHTVHHEFAEGIMYGAIAVFYEDGRNDTIMLRYGHHARNCYFSPPKPLEDPESAVAWDAGQSFERGNPTLYRSTWENPNPESEVVMIHFVSMQIGVAPILFAITAE